jgi:antitoxin CptB
MALPPGLLENDLFIERFFRRYEETLTARQVEGLQLLMDLADNDLLDLLLARKDPRAPGHPGGRDVLVQLRQPA